MKLKYIYIYNLYIYIFIFVKYIYINIFIYIKPRLLNKNTKIPYNFSLGESSFSSKI